MCYTFTVEVTPTTSPLRALTLTCGQLGLTRLEMTTVSVPCPTTHTRKFPKTKAEESNPPAGDSSWTQA